MYTCVGEGVLSTEVQVLTPKDIFISRLPIQKQRFSSMMTSYLGFHACCSIHMTQKCVDADFF